MKKWLKDQSGQVEGVVVLLAMILVGVVGGIIALSFYNSVLTTSPQSTNTNLLAVQNTYIPLFIVAIVAGAVISALIYAVMFATGRKGL